MKKTYKVLAVLTKSANDTSAIQKAIDAHADDGYRLVSTVYIPQYTSMDSRVHLPHIVAFMEKDRSD